MEFCKAELLTSFLNLYDLGQVILPEFQFGLSSKMEVNYLVCKADLKTRKVTSVRCKATRASVPSVIRRATAETRIPGPGLGLGPRGAAQGRPGGGAR